MKFLQDINYEKAHIRIIFDNFKFQSITAIFFWEKYITDTPKICHNPWTRKFAETLDSNI